MKSPQVANMIVKSLIQSITDKVAQVSTFAGEAQSNVRVVQPSGIVSVPTEAGEAILGAVNGASSRRVTLVVVNPSEPDAPQGETWIYSADAGSVIKLTPDGVSIEAESVSVQATNFTWNGDRVAVAGDVDSAGHAIQ